MLCTAKRSNGQPCTRQAIKGGRVCYNHGGAAPQVKKSAALRLAELVDPAIGVVAATIKNSRRPDLALKASLDVLDRNGHKQPDKLELSNPEGQEFNFRVLSDSELNTFSALFSAISTTRGVVTAEEESD